MIALLPLALVALLIAGIHWAHEARTARTVAATLALATAQASEAPFDPHALVVDSAQHARFNAREAIR